MRHIKDFFYNWNDIIVVMLILAIAIVLILWRVDIIMAYPSTIVSSLNGDNGTGNTGSGGSGQSGVGGGGGGTSSGGGSGSGSGGSVEPTPGQGPRDSTIWNDGRLKVNMTVNIPAGSATGAVQALIDAGLFASYEDFEAVCERAGTEPGSILATTFTFEAGSTQEDIALKVTGADI